MLRTLRHCSCRKGVSNISLQRPFRSLQTRWAIYAENTTEIAKENHWTGSISICLYVTVLKENEIPCASDRVHKGLPKLYWLHSPEKILHIVTRTIVIKCSKLVYDFINLGGEIT